MSLHIELTDEAKQELQSQRRKTMASAVTVSVLGMGLMIIAFYLIVIVIAAPPEPEIVSYTTNQSETTDPDNPEVKTSTSRPTAASASAVKTIVSTAVTDVAVVNPDIVVDVPSESLAQGFDIGTGLGGTGDGVGSGLPSGLVQRCSKDDRLKRIRDNGGVVETEDAVVKSLNWLKSQQQGDGSWSHDGSPKYRAAMTGLAILTFLAHCETPMSEDYGEQVLKGMTYLVNLAMKSPYCSTTPAAKEICYEHAIATYALCESYTFCKDMGIPALDNLDKAAIKCVEKILAGQQGNGGWGYSYDGSHVDLSVVGWNIQALKAADHAGLKLPKEKSTKTALKKAAGYVKACATPESMFKYQPGSSAHPPLQGVGLLSLQMTGEGNDAVARKGYDWVKTNIVKFNYNSAVTHAEPGKYDRGDPYMYYYLVQAMLNRGGEYWEKYNSIVIKDLYKNQEGNGKFKAGGGLFQYSPVYQQCLCTLSMEAYYRFLPGTGEGTK